MIRSAPSRFDVFLSSLPELVAGANDVVKRANRLFDEDNLKAVTHALGNLENASRGLPQTVHDLNALVSELRGATAELGATARSARGVIVAVGPDVRAGGAAPARGRRSSGASRAMSSNSILAENRQDIRAFTRDGLPEIERFVREGRAAAADIRALSNSLREDPTQLLYQPAERGVEIPR